MKVAEERTGGVTWVCESVLSAVPKVMMGTGADLLLTGSWGCHRVAALEAAGLLVPDDADGSPPFSRLARLMPPAGGPADSAFGPHLCFVAAISRSSRSVSSRSSSVGPVPTRCSRGGLAPPPMNEANEGGPPSVDLAPPPEAASLRMLARAEAAPPDADGVPLDV